MQKNYFPKWPYDKALLWMNKSHEQVLENPLNIIIGCGSHEERVITLGRNLSCNNIDQEAILATKPNIIIRKLDRGGGPTAHEPGQLVLYPVLNLASLELGVADLIDILQNTMLMFLASMGVPAQSDPVNPGVYIDGHKIGFIGMRIKEGISLHGLAINIFNDAKIFALFDPCGIRSLPLTSLKYHADIREKPLALMIKLVECFEAKVQEKRKKQPTCE